MRAVYDPGEPAPTFSHWHWYALPNGKDTRETVTYPSGTLGHDTLLYEVFLPRLNVVNFQAGMA